MFPWRNFLEWALRVELLKKEGNEAGSNLDVAEKALLVEVRLMRVWEVMEKPGKVLHGSYGKIMEMSYLDI